MSSVRDPPVDEHQVVGRHQRRGEHRGTSASRRRASASANIPRIASDAEQHAADAPRERAVAEQLDRAGDEQLDELRMLGVGVLAGRIAGVGLACAGTAMPSIRRAALT